MFGRWETFAKSLVYIVVLWLALWLGFNIAVPITADFFDWASRVAGIETYMWFEIWNVDTYQAIIVLTSLLSAIIVVVTHQSLAHKKQEEQDRLFLLWTFFLSEKHDFEPPDEEKEPWKADFRKFVGEVNKVNKLMAMFEDLRPSTLKDEEGN
ncbi:MAG: hypothetical protein CFE32_16175 [Alphaproteobacteria bacterium PA3]|nr:MAG: hypothetical protein CFE32_16175 [Alphaproteobacteria bacterium PA3]